eukprot:COSAG06_NODE_54672_length_293_cov_1.030928_1_plen_88_part_01
MPLMRRPFDIGWYRKTFEVPVDASAGKLVYLDFDGVYRAADFWLNGVWLGHHESGYAPFRWYIHNATGAKLNTVGKTSCLRHFVLNTI